MPDNLPATETLTLRFRAVEARRNRRVLPGAVWLWFLLGAGVGMSVWVIGKQNLAQRLAAKVGPENSMPTSLFAMQALDTLDIDGIDHLVSGLKHDDLRVAKAAFQRINVHLDQLASHELTQQYTMMRQLANQLHVVGASVPPSHATLVRSLAARLFSIVVTLDDPHVAPIADICQKVLIPAQSMIEPHTSIAIAQLSEIPQSPPLPLPRVETAAISKPRSSESQLANQRIHRSSSNPSNTLRLVTSPTVHTEVAQVADGNSNDVAAEQQSIAGNAISDRLSDDPVSISLSDTGPIVSTSPTTSSYTPQEKSAHHDPQTIQRLEINELVRLLASDHADTAKAATLALRQRGMSESRINLAMELATANSQRRIELIQLIAAAGDTDPRPWLLWMAEDGEAEVRKCALSWLIPMADHHVLQRLREMALRESDTRIRETIYHAVAKNARQ